MSTHVRYFLLLILVTIPLFYASVQSWIWSQYVAAIFLLFVIAWWREKVTFRDNGLTSGWLMYLFFGWSLFQLVPIPGGLLSQLSPFRASLLDRAYEMTHISYSFHPIAYEHALALSRWSLWLAAFLLAVLVQAACRDKNFLISLTITFLIVAGFEAIYGLIQTLVPSTGVLGYHITGLGDARGTYINRNHFAGMMEMIWPLGLGYLLSISPRKNELKLRHLIYSEHFGKQLSISLLLVVILLAAVFSRSRSGITGLFVGFAAFMGAMAFSGAGMRKGFWFGMGGAISLLLIYCIQMGFGSVLARFLSINNDLGRLDIWRDAWFMVRQHPLGAGAGNYQVLEPLFQTNAKDLVLSVHAHNDYLQLLVETGWPGFMLLTGGWIYILANGLLGIRKMFRTWGYSTRFFMGVGTWSGLVSIGFHSFFDFNLQIPANLFYFSALIGIFTHLTSYLEKPLRFRA